ncbi:13853_t:CDS:2, partial [Gigaspora rosea]
WTKSNPMDQEEFEEEWRQDYKPKENINIENYKILEAEISQEEATGQTMISNEMLKKLPTRGYE